MAEDIQTKPQRSLFRKRPVVIEAHRWMQHDDPETGALGNDHMSNWLAGAFHHIDGDRLFITTLEGVIAARYGDWVVQGVKGEFYPVRADIFAATHERVSDSDKRAKNQ